MDRRKFIITSAAAVAAGAVSGTASAFTASGIFKDKKKTAEEFSAGYSSETGKAGKEDLLVRFLGTGAADWDGVDERGELRRFSGILIDNRIVIDFTPSEEDMLPEGFRKPDAVFYTHSHRDHYNAQSAIGTLGADVIYLSDTWLERAKANFAESASELGKPLPKVTGISVGEAIRCGDITVTALPGNHSTSDASEQALIYLIEKGAVRVLYATDTGGITSRAARIAGIDAHVPDGKPITGLIMEATMGIDHDEDFRIYTHSSVGTVLRTAHVLQATGRLKAPSGQPVYLTHLARTLHGTQSQLDSQLPSPLRAAHDGLEVIFRA